MFSIVSWNIQYGKGVDGITNLGRIAEVIHQEGLPDILCFQEVSINDPGIDNGNDQASALKSFFPDYDHFFGTSYNRFVHKNKNRKKFGNLVLTRHSPDQVLNHLLPSPADPKVRFMPRQVTELVIKANSGTFRMMNTHLEFFSEKQQIAQVYRILDIHNEACDQFNEPGIDMPNTPFEIIQRQEKMIICGDFNFIVDSTPYKILTESIPGRTSNLVDAWSIIHSNKKHTPTCGLFDQKQWKQGPHCRDFFFVSNILKNKVKKFTVNTKTSASDHQPIRLIIDI